MKQHLCCLAYLVFSLLFISTVRFSQTDSTQGGPTQGGTAAQGGSGKIQGRVTDEKGEPVPFANLIISNSRMGAASS